MPDDMMKVISNASNACNLAPANLLGSFSTLHRLRCVALTGFICGAWLQCNSLQPARALEMANEANVHGAQE